MRLLLPSILKALAFAALACAASAQAATSVATGDTTGAATFTRPLADLSGLSAASVGVAYNSFAFSVDTAGSYDFRSFARPVLDPAWDNFLILDAGTFNPASALGNAVIASDDFNGNIGQSGFSFTLAPGAADTLVTTGFEPDDFGGYITVIRGLGSVIPVPEPGPLALLLAGLAAVGWIALRRSA